MAANYIGYWLIGAAFVALGMLASLLTRNATIAFILGAVFCAAFVQLAPVGGVLGEGVERILYPLTVWERFNDFSRGVLSLSGLVYFVSVTATMLYFNIILVGRRNWPPRADGYRMGFHHLLRAVAVTVAVVALNTLVARASVRMDLTAEKLHSLSKETQHLLREIPRDRPVLVQAYLSKDVPTAFVQTRANLVGFLKEIDAAAGGRVEVLIHDTEPFSQDARDAREKFGIVPVEVPVVQGRVQNTQVFLGVAFTCGAEEDVIPFFDRGLPTEYELVRSIRVVAGTERRRIGILNTAAKLFGGIDFNTFQSEPGWPVVEELKKQYDVVQISATDEITEKLDALVVALPSSLSQEEMDNLAAYVEAGNPTLLLDDPLPIIDVSLAPSEEAGAGTNPFMRGRGPQPKPKGDIEAFMTRLGIRWQTPQVVWDSYNPHPDLANLPPEVVFVGRGNNNPRSFNTSYPATSDLQEVVFMFPGTIDRAADSKYAFDPLLKTGTMSGALHYEDFVQKTFFGTQVVNPRNARRPTAVDYTLAAYVHGEAGVDTTSGKARNVRLVMAADLDFVSEQFFEIRRRGIEGFNFDNVTFVLNCIDMLVGDDSFIALRNRRVKHRTLETVENKTQEYVERRAADEQQAALEAQRALMQAQGRLDQKVREVRARADLDEQAKEIMARNLQEVESRRFEALKATIDAEKEAKLQRSKENTEGEIRRIQNGIKMLAGLAPPIPVFIVGIFVFLRRRKREKEGAAAARRLRG
jgi:ABC-2 type transport system permease protein